MFSNINTSDFGLKLLKSSHSFKLNPKKFPSISFDNFNQNFIIYYPGPPGFGQQSFSFEWDDFILSFQQAKFKHSTPKLDYIDFFDSFQFISGKSLNPYVKFVFSFFYINPTILKKAIHQNKKLKRKITLQPNIIKLNKYFLNVN